MSIVELLALILKVVGQILDLHAQGQLSQEKKDALVAALHQVQ